MTCPKCSPQTYWEPGSLCGDCERAIEERDGIGDDQIIALAVSCKLGRTMKPLGLSTGDVFATDSTYRTGELLDFARRLIALAEERRPNGL